MRSIYIRKLNQAGDTIVEVMIALALLSLSLGISYASATRGLNQSQNAEEHSTALGILDGQLEQLRSAITSQVSGIPASGFFCMVTPASSGGSPFQTFPSATPVPNTAQADSQGQYSEYPSASPTSCVQGIYHVSIAPATTIGSNSVTYGYITPTSSGENSYTFMIRWDGIGGLGPQQESLTYRIGTGEGGSYAGGITIAPPITYTSQTLSGDSGSCFNPNVSPWYCGTNSVIIGGTSYAAVNSFQALYLCPIPYNSSDNPYINPGVRFPSACPAASGPYNFIMSYTFSSGAVSPTTDSNGYTLTINYTNAANGSLEPPPAYEYSYQVTIGDSTNSDLAQEELPPPTSNNQNMISSPINLSGLTNLTSQPITVTWSNDYCCSYDANFQINNVTLTPN